MEQEDSHRRRLSWTPRLKVPLPSTLRTLLIPLLLVGIVLAMSAQDAKTTTDAIGLGIQVFVVGAVTLLIATLFDRRW